jgi:hypothetical protein
MAKRIQLIVTGDMERKAMVDALRGIFPDRVGRVLVEWQKATKVDGTTSSRLLRPEDGINSSMVGLARAMVAELLDGRDRRGPADLVVAVDDLELNNLDQPSLVVSQVKAAVHEMVRQRASAEVERAELLAQLQERCSFHLVTPMIESYLFADPVALRTAGVPSGTPTRLRWCSVEDFESADPAWLKECRAKNAEQAARGYTWWRQECHPKAYLTKLLPPGKIYVETVEGVAALRRLDWTKVKTPASGAPFIRALFADLAEWFEIDSPLGHGECARETSPLHLKDRRGLLLRNL